MTKTSNEWNEEFEREWGKVFDRAFPDFQCRACNAKSWTVVRPDSTGEVGVLLFARWPAGTISSVVPTLAVQCNNCGLTELFHEKTLLRFAYGSSPANE